MNANHIRVTWINGDGSIDYEDLQLSAGNDIFNVTSIETLVKQEG